MAWIKINTTKVWHYCVFVYASVYLKSCKDHSLKVKNLKTNVVNITFFRSGLVPLLHQQIPRTFREEGQDTQLQNCWDCQEGKQVVPPGLLLDKDISPNTCSCYKILCWMRAYVPTPLKDDHTNLTLRSSLTCQKLV